MNWNRAKSMLLLIFVLLNLILAYFNFSQQAQILNNPLSSDAIYDTLRNRLLDEKITVLQSIPKKTPKSSVLNLKKDDTSLLLVDKLFQEQETEKETVSLVNEEMGFIIKTKSEELFISSDDFMTYYNHSNDEEIEAALISYDFAKSVAESFIKNRLGFSTFNYRYEPFSGVENIAPMHNIIYCPTYKGASVFDLGIDLIVEGDRVVTGNFNIYKIVSPVGKEEWVAPAADILLRLTQDDLILQFRDQALQQGENWLVITDMRFGYFSFYQSGSEIQAQPVWRIDLKDGQVIYYDAFTAQRLFNH